MNIFRGISIYKKYNEQFCSPLSLSSLSLVSFGTIRITRSPATKLACHRGDQRDISCQLSSENRPVVMPAVAELEIILIDPLMVYPVYSEADCHCCTELPRTKKNG